MMTLIFGLFCIQLAIIFHVVVSSRKSELPTIVWVAVCLTLPIIGYVGWYFATSSKDIKTEVG
jgi:hypothetical protein